MLMENAPYGVIFIDSHETIRYINPEFKKITGYSVKNILYLSDWIEKAFPDQKKRKQFISIWNKNYGKKKIADRVFQVTCIDGVIKDIEFNISFLKHNMVIITLHDVTEKIRTEKELRNSRDNLEKRVIERTVEIEETNKKLLSEINERIKIEEDLSVSLKEKDILLKEIHHRVKNNLQVISSLLSLQSQTVKDAQSQKIFMESQNRIHSIALIHEKLYQSKDLSHINICDYINELLRDLLYSYGTNPENIKTETYIDNLFLNIETAIPCGLIINELVSNSLKYAFPGGKKGEIRIHFNKYENSKLILIVKDNGVGLPGDINFRKGETLGLKLVSNLSKQLNGES